MAIPLLVKRRMRHYVEQVMEDDSDHAIVELLLAAQKYSKIAKIFTVAGCEACRARKIASSAELTALARGKDFESIAVALETFHRVTEAETMLDLVMQYAKMLKHHDLTRAAIVQLGRWMHLPPVRHRMGSLACIARDFDVRLLATQILWANDITAEVDAAVHASPLIARYLPTVKPGPKPKDYLPWIRELPARRQHVEARATAAELSERARPVQ